MEHVHANGAARIAFPADETGTGWFAALRRKLRGLLHPGSRGAMPAARKAPRPAPDPYFDVWLEKRLHGDGK